MLFVLFAVALAFQGQASGQGRMGAGAGPSSPASGTRADAPTTHPFAIQRFEPEYTQDAIDAKLQGIVSLLVVITPDGKASQINVVKSLGLGLDQEAVECVEKWRFRPAMRNGEAVSVRATIEINFRLPK